MKKSLLAQNFVPSPNFRERGENTQLLFVIVHGTWMRRDDEAIARLCDPAAEVSCHYYIDRAGGVTQLVDEAKSAFHAGKSSYMHEGVLIENLNDWSIGIELGNAGPFEVAPTADGERGSAIDWSRAEPYTLPQYAAVEALVGDLLVRYSTLKSAYVLPHSSVSPGRKTDPGEHFDWAWKERL